MFLDVIGFIASWMSNPWSYTIALIGAILWAGYSSMTRAWSNGNNPVVVIFFNDMAIFALIWAFTPSVSFEWMQSWLDWGLFGCGGHGLRLRRMDLWDAARQHDVIGDWFLLYACTLMRIRVLLDWCRTHRDLLAGSGLVGLRIDRVLVVGESSKARRQGGRAHQTSRLTKPKEGKQLKKGLTLNEASPFVLHFVLTGSGVELQTVYVRCFTLRVPTLRPT